MTRVVEAVAPEFEAYLGWEKVITKELSGAMRYGELSKRLGRPAPVPSIFINGELIFDMTPSQEDLSDCLERLISEADS
jgi:hypothetical protein